LVEPFCLRILGIRRRRSERSLNGRDEIRGVKGPNMSQITYKVVKHDGGWAYEANGTYSEPFPTRDAARKAAKLAASEQAAPGETTQISYEDEKGHWHNEVDSGTDRPKTTVEG
jgi:Uncharacterized protein conserved in bacteria (DUF2188)